MFQYKNHRFHFGGISFQIPDGYFFDSGRKDEGDILFRLHAPDQSFAIDVRIEMDLDGILTEMQNMLDDFGSDIVYPPAPLQMNGLHGYHTTYRNRRSQSYEAWFDLGAENALSLTLTTRSNILDIDTAAVLAAIDPRAEG
jgi:hypothetical protein